MRRRNPTVWEGDRCIRVLIRAAKMEIPVDVRKWSRCGIAGYGSRGLDRQERHAKWNNRGVCGKALLDCWREVLLVRIKPLMCPHREAIERVVSVVLRHEPPPAWLKPKLGAALEATKSNQVNRHRDLLRQWRMLRLVVRHPSAVAAALDVSEGAQKSCVFGAFQFPTFLGSVAVA